MRKRGLFLIWFVCSALFAALPRPGVCRRNALPAALNCKDQAHAAHSRICQPGLMPGEHRPITDGCSRIGPRFIQPSP